jgi:hypothetical protein
MHLVEKPRGLELTFLQAFLGVNVFGQIVRILGVIAFL